MKEYRAEWASKSKISSADLFTPHLQCPETLSGNWGRWGGPQIVVPRKRFLAPRAQKALPEGTESSEPSRVGGGGFGVNELADFGALALEVGEVLFAEFLIDLKFVLCFFLLSGADVSLAKTVVGVG